MKASELIEALKKAPGEDPEVYFRSCCYPTTKWLTTEPEDDGIVLDGYRGSYVAGDPETSPW